MDQKKLKTFRDKLEAKKTEIVDAYSKNKIYGMEADGDGAQDVADKAANSYTKEFLFSLSSTERELIQQVEDALTPEETRGRPLGFTVLLLPGAARAGFALGLTL
jgi:RNA polymerase-binding transcription factor DksA